jgi:predicted O-linked N-acetylglucosamine transferase (SPINDLY family)
MGHLERAKLFYHRVLELDPGISEAHFNLGSILHKQGRPGEAVVCYQRAVALKPGFFEAFNNLGNAYQDLQKRDEAIDAYSKAIALHPDFARAANNLGNAFKDSGRLPEALAQYRRAVELDAEFVEAHSNLVYSLSFCPEFDAAAILEQHRLWAEKHAVQWAAVSQGPFINTRKNGRLRIGYVSPNFRNHCQSLFTVPLLSAHDHQRFETVCYSDTIRPEDLTERIRSLADHWREIDGLSDEQVVQLIQQDQIDILVDLTMHMGNGRPLVFARKPAPIQVCWLAYPGTTGVKAIDYRLTDVFLDPPGTSDHYYSEQSIRLPDCFWCYDPLGQKPDVNDLPAARNGYITFGSLNNFCKVNDDVLRLWAAVLMAVAGSRLMLLAGHGSHRRRTVEFLEKEGVGPDRITFQEMLPREEYLQLYHRLDIGLDTFPYNGHTTSLDSFWMGVPVVTLVGHTVVGRAGLCQLQNLSLTELVAKTEGQFVAIATGLANDLPRLSQMRSTLRERMEKSPLMDGPRFARNVETAYRQMWQRLLAGAAPFSPDAA